MNRNWLMIGFLLSICAIKPARAELTGADAEAARTGWYIAAAARCGLPSAPFEAELDRYIRVHGIASSEGNRLKAIMMHYRSDPIGVAAGMSCDSVKERLQKIQPPEPTAAPAKKGGRG